ncbi:MAG: hypothetical protein K0U84_02860 [Actinomycetia bacterium]|nr:hypothetical protein [Actinomycetes bacterium]
MDSEHATAPLTFSGVSSTGPVPIAVWDSVRCEEAAVGSECKLDESLPPAESFYKSTQVYGILGIALAPDKEGSTPNPLPYVSESFSAYTITLDSDANGTLTSGLLPSSEVQYSLDKVDPASVKAPDPPSGVSYWTDNDLQACFSFTPNKSECQKTMFDTGATSMFPTTNLPGAPRVAPGEPLNGTTLYFFGNNPDSASPLWEVTGAAKTDQAMIIRDPDQGAPQMVIGRPIFTAYSFGYDLSNGTIQMTKQQ